MSDDLTAHERAILEWIRFGGYDDLAAICQQYLSGKVCVRTYKHISRPRFALDAAADGAP